MGMLRELIRKIFFGLTKDELVSIDPQIVVLLNRQTRPQLRLIRKLISLIES